MLYNCNLLQIQLVLAASLLLCTLGSFIPNPLPFKHLENRENLEVRPEDAESLLEDAGQSNDISVNEDSPIFIFRSRSKSSQQRRSRRTPENYPLENEDHEELEEAECHVSRPLFSHSGQQSRGVQAHEEKIVPRLRRSPPPLVGAQIFPKHASNYLGGQALNGELGFRLRRSTEGTPLQNEEVFAAQRYGNGRKQLRLHAREQRRS